MNLNLENKHALVCGGSKGIGAAMASALAQEGANVTLVSRNEEKLKAQLHTLMGTGHSYRIADLNEPSDLDHLVQGLANEPVDIVINNTGGPAPGPISDADAGEFQSALNRHLYASHAIMQAVLPYMKQQLFGRFINVISTSVKIPIPGLGVSNTTRAAMASWAKTLSNEVAPYGITVNNILPGAVDTSRLNDIIQNIANKSGEHPEHTAEAMKKTIPAGRFGRPDELGDLAAFLASDKAAYITGVSIPVDGGRTGSL